MNTVLADAVALKMFIHDARALSGVTRHDAEEKWRQIGPQGRKHWRDLAKVAHDEIMKSAGRKPAAPSPSSVAYKPDGRQY